MLFLLYGTRLEPRARRCTGCGTGGCTPRSSPAPMCCSCAGLGAFAAGALGADRRPLHRRAVICACCRPPCSPSSHSPRSRAANVAAAVVSAFGVEHAGHLRHPGAGDAADADHGCRHRLAAADPEIVVQLLPPFIVGQLRRPAASVLAHTTPTKVVDRGRYLVVYAACSAPA